MSKDDTIDVESLGEQKLTANELDGLAKILFMLIDIAEEEDREDARTIMLEEQRRAIKLLENALYNTQQLLNRIEKKDETIK
jgi:hypothetical protein